MIESKDHSTSLIHSSLQPFGSLLDPTAIPASSTRLYLHCITLQCNIVNKFYIILFMHETNIILQT